MSEQYRSRIERKKAMRRKPKKRKEKFAETYPDCPCASFFYWRLSEERLRSLRC